MTEIATFTILDKTALASRPTICILRGPIKTGVISTGMWLINETVATVVLGLEFHGQEPTGEARVVVPREVFELLRLGTTLHEVHGGYSPIRGRS